MPLRINGIIFITAGSLRSSSDKTFVAFSNNLSINPFSVSIKVYDMSLLILG